MRFVSPAWFLLLVPLAAGLFWSWRCVFGMSKGRKKLAFAVRAALLLLVVVALAGPQTRRANSGQATMFVLDRSDSVSDKDKKAAEVFVRTALGQLGDDDVAGVVAFGSTPLLDSAVGGRRTFVGIQSKVDGSASDLAGAVRLAAATLPQGKGRRIVLLSDGNETRGDLAQAAEVAATEGIEIDAFALGTGERAAEASVVEFKTPTERRADEPFEGRVVIDSSVPQRATVVIDRDGVVVARQAVSLDKGRNVISIDQKLPQPGFFRYRATLEPMQDTDTRNNVGASFTTVRGKPQVLLLQGDRSKSELAGALQGQGIDVKLFGAEGLPTRPEEVQAYDAVVLNDMNAALLTPEQMKLLQAATRDTGIGLVMVGGENSFLPGGWYGTPVAEALPVDLNIRQRKTYPSTTVLIIADASGSMGMIEDGVQKIRLAAKAAEETVKLLSPLDRVGVAGSSDGIEAVPPIQELKNKESVISQVRKLRTGGGGIYAEPSVRYADRALRAESTKVRHFILLADGADVDDYGDSIRIVEQMRADKITTSVVSIGDGMHVPFLKALAIAGGGRFYLATKASKLPAIFTQDVAVMGRSAIEEVTFVPEFRGGDEATKGFIGQDFPALFAYCLADSRPLAKVSLVSPKRDPILASWQYGLGSSLAFMSDAQSRWASRWVGWSGFGRLWAQAIRSVSRKASQNQYQLDVTQQGGKGQVRLRASDRLGQPLSGNQMTVRASSPSGENSDVVLTQEAPGEFSGEFPAGELGSYIVSVAESTSTGQSRVNASGFSVPYPPEYRSYRTNTPLLASLAAVTGGRALKSPAEALRKIGNSGESISDIWQLFLLAAALLLPFDIAVRRIALPFGAILAAMRSRLTGRPVARQTEAVGRLIQAKQRAKPDGQEPVRVPESSTAADAAPRAPAQIEQTHVSAAAKLLEERRKRKGQDEP